MSMKSALQLCCAVAIVGSIAAPVSAAPVLYGATPYRSVLDSPFATLGLAQFYLETFEDGLLNTPGVAITNNQPGGTALGVIGPGGATDSVDSDDGTIDGSGTNGRSYANLLNQGYGSFGLTVTFSSVALGGLPTYAGFVWTDGSQTASTVFEAFDADGVSLGVIGPLRVGDSSFLGTTAEDRFFGVFNAEGISRLTLRDPGSVNSLEIDHLQYGRAGVPTSTVPVPSTAFLLGVGVFALTGTSLSQRRRKLRQLLDA